VERDTECRSVDAERHSAESDGPARDDQWYADIRRVAAEAVESAPHEATRWIPGRKGPVTLGEERRHASGRDETTGDNYRAAQRREGMDSLRAFAALERRPRPPPPKLATCTSRR
jgi:hypothetical protein